MHRIAGEIEGIRLLDCRSGSLGPCRLVSVTMKEAGTVALRAFRRQSTVDIA